MYKALTIGSTPTTGGKASLVMRKLLSNVTAPEVVMRPMTPKRSIRLLRGSSRRSYHARHKRLPSRLSASDGCHWSRRVASSFTLTGADQLEPPSDERAK